MKELTQRLKPRESLAITGMGGIGKTELCRRYFWNMEESVPYVAWIDYAQGIETDLVSQITGHTIIYAPKDTIFERFNTLCKELNELPPDTVIIVDNVTNPDDPGLELLNSLPFRVLVSARGPLPHFSNEIPLDFLNSEECKEVFLTHYKRRPLDDSEYAALDEIIRRAGQHTLTVELLGKTAQAEELKLSELLKNLQENGFDLAPEIQTEVRSSWSKELPALLFNHLRKLFDMANLTEAEKRILSRIALLASVPIAKRQIKKLLNLNSLSELNKLKDTGWLQADEENFLVWMHPVLKDVVLHEAKPNINECQSFIEVIVNLFHCQLDEHVLQKAEYLVHGKSVLEVFESEVSVSIASLANEVAIYLRAAGNYVEALEQQQKAVTIRKQMVPSNHPDLATSYNVISLIYSDMGEHKQALEWQQEAVAIREQALPSNHPDLAASYNNLSFMYRDMGEYDKALKQQQKAVTIHKQILPANHPSLAASYNNLSNIYRNMGKYENALEWQQASLAIREQVLPANHADVAQSYNNLSLVYRDMGKYEQALEHQYRAVAIRKQALSPKHPFLATSYHYLSSIYRAMGEYKEALEWQQKSLAIREQALPTNYPNLASSYDNLSLIYRDMAEYDKALEWQQKSLAIRLQVLSANHPDLAASYNSLSLIYLDVGEYDKALEWQQKSLAIRLQVLTANHPDLKASYNNLSSIYNAMGK